jgi:hypothetical protein
MVATPLSPKSIDELNDLLKYDVKVKVAGEIDNQPFDGLAVSFVCLPVLLTLWVFEQA